MFSEQDKIWMQHAIHLAEKALQANEVPIGAVLIHDEKIIGEGWNQPISHCDPTAHAEIIALRDAAKNIGNYRLVNTTLYITLEPCVMCVGAIIHARIKRVVYGASDPKTGAVNSVFQFEKDNQLNHCVKYQGGLFPEKCGEMLSEFFRKKRREN